MMSRMKDSYAALLGWRRGLIRNSDAGELLELFLVAAVCAVLGIRAFLAAAGYPQIGGSGLHIAHMLWGGGFMMIALILLFSFLSRSLDRVAAVLGGVGFGAFIDELGKFITSDNDYFYAPTIGLIYVIFISIFLVLRTVRRARVLQPSDALANALNQIQGSIATPFDTKKKAHILALLNQADPSHPLLPHLRAFIEEAEPSRDDPAHFYFRLKDWTMETYRRLVRRRRFAVIFPALILTWAISEAVALVYLVYGISGEAIIDNLNWTHYAQAVSSSVTILCIAIGIKAWASNRARSYRWYIRGVLVSIFITQVFVFFHSQLAAITGLAINVLTYATLDFVSTLEAGAERPTQAPG